MIDFKNSTFAKLRAVPNENFISLIESMFVNGESVISSFQGIRDGVVFTNKRIISINTQGITGKKKDFTSLPYCKIQTFSIETAGTFDMDSELDVYFSGLGIAKFEFTGKSNITEIGRMISTFVL